MTGPRWLGAAPALEGPIHIVAPHPDDEVLGAAGLMVWATTQRLPVTVHAVTDGEASHGSPSPSDATARRARRAEERTEALERLGVSPEAVHRLGFPDGAVAEHTEELARVLRAGLSAAATVVAPAPSDDHPDHRATWRATGQALKAGHTLVGMAIWTRVTEAQPPPGAYVLALEAATLERKRAAVGCFRSQVERLVGAEVPGPVLCAAQLDAMTSPTEWFIP